MTHPRMGRPPPLLVHLCVALPNNPRILPTLDGIHYWIRCWVTILACWPGIHRSRIRRRAPPRRQRRLRRSCRAFPTLARGPIPGLGTAPGSLAGWSGPGGLPLAGPHGRADPAVRGLDDEGLLGSDDRDPTDRAASEEAGNHNEDEDRDEDASA